MIFFSFLREGLNKKSKRKTKEEIKSCFLSCAKMLTNYAWLRFIRGNVSRKLKNIKYFRSAKQIVVLFENFPKDSIEPQAIF